MGRNPFTSEGPSSKQHTKTMALHWTSTRVAWLCHGCLVSSVVGVCGTSGETLNFRRG